MAFFKFRKAADEPASAPPQPQSIEAIRQRAKHRLVGATVLVVLGVIGFPLLFDKQPRPIAVDTPIDIPERNKVPPLTLPAASVPVSAAVLPASAAPAASKPVLVQAPAAVTNETVIETEFKDKKQAVAQVKPRDDATKNKVIEVTKPANPVASAAAKPADVSKPKVAPDTKKTDASAAQSGRYVVQVGAFADAVRVQEVRQKLEHAGLKTYTNVAETKDGKRTRVRVGPFSVKAEAEKSVEKIKKLNLPAALLTL